MAFAKRVHWIACELLSAGTEQLLDAVERFALAASVAEGLLLDAASALIDRNRAELHVMESTEDRDGASTDPAPAAGQTEANNAQLEYLLGSALG